MMQKHGKGAEKTRSCTLKERLYDRRYWLALLLVVLFGIYLNLAFFYGPSWINGSDNYFYMQEANLLAHGHAGQFNCNIVDCVKYIIFAGIAPFIALLGYTPFAASLFGILCFCLTIVVIYVIGTLLHSRLAGLLSGFLYSVFPLVLSQSSNVGDDIPMVLLVSVSVLLVLLALNNERHGRRYLFLAGFVSAINILTVSEAAIGLLLVFTLVVFVVLPRKEKNRDSAKVFGAYLVGLFLAFLVIAMICVYETGMPFGVLAVYSQNYNAFNGPPAFSSYLNDLFPHGPTSIQDGLVYGYFGYAFVIAALYLIATRFRKAAVLGYWFAFSFLYISFGSQSLARYVYMIYAGPRYGLVLVPAMVLIIGIGLARLIDNYKKGSAGRRLAVYLFVALVLFVLVVSSIRNIIDINYSQLYSTEPLLQFGKYLNALPSGASIYGPGDMPWFAYVNQSRHVVEIGYVKNETTCADIRHAFNLTPGSYLIGNVVDYGSCSLMPVFSPQNVYWLDNYTLFRGWGLNFYSYKIYRYTPA
jgi:hypothetical protein